MLTIRQRKAFGKSKKNKKKVRVYNLKGGRKISLKEPYSLKRDKKKKIVHLFRDGEEISFFGEDAAVVTIEGYASGDEFDLQRKQKEKERKEKKNAGI